MAIKHLDEIPQLWAILSRNGRGLENDHPRSRYHDGGVCGQVYEYLTVLVIDRVVRLRKAGDRTQISIGIEIEHIIVGVGNIKDHVRVLALLSIGTLRPRKFECKAT